MMAVDIFRRNASLYPHSCGEVLELPSGALMLDITLGSELYYASNRSAPR